MKKREIGFTPKHWMLLSFCAALWIVTALRLVWPTHALAQSTNRVEVARINGVIDNFTDGYVERVLNVARDDGAQALVIQLDTPGGELDATRGRNPRGPELLAGAPVG